MKYGEYSINEDGETAVSKMVRLVDDGSKVIEFGSSSGYILDYLKSEKKCIVHGYDFDEDAVDFANKSGVPSDLVNLDDVDDLFFKGLDNDIDYILCADVLEHLKNMVYVISGIGLYLKKHPNCRLLVSFPNITYYGVIDQLLHGSFKYQELGILDNTHLRFYDKYELEKVFNNNSLELVGIDSVILMPSDSEFKVPLNKKVVEILHGYENDDYLVYQYVFELKHVSSPLTKIVKDGVQGKNLDFYLEKELHLSETLSKRIEVKDYQIINLNKECGAAIKERDAVIKDYNSFLSSTSWRMTKPFRLLGRVIRNPFVLKDYITQLFLSNLVGSARDFIYSKGSIKNIQRMAERRSDVLFSRSHVDFCNDLNHEFPPIDISVVTHDSSKWLDMFFESLNAVDYPKEKINLFIVDNASSDDTLAILKLKQKEKKEGLSSFTVFSMPNDGFGSGHDYAIRQGNSDYVLVSNVDLEFEKDSIRKVVNRAVSDALNVASWELRQKPYEHPKYVDPVTCETSWSSHACILIKRSAYEEVGGYEKRIFMYGEDVELSYRFRRAGYILRYVPSAVVHHYSYKESGEVKPLQFLGSTLANSYLRLRYGSLTDKLKIPLMQFALFIQRSRLVGRKLILKNWMSIIKNGFYFLGSGDGKKYSFSGFDYELSKDGAFYECIDIPKGDFPLVSIVTRTYKGRSSLLREAVVSVLNQTYPNIQHVIVEDGGDSAASLIQKIRKEYSCLEIEYLPLGKVGRSAAGNSGLAAAKGELLMFLDDDDLLMPDHIEVLVSNLIDTSDISAAYSLAWQVETEFQEEGGQTEYIERSFSTDDIFYQKFSRELMLNHNYIPIQSILFRRSLYEEYGGFDEELKNLEDWNLWMRYSYLNDFIFVDKTTSLYRVPANENMSLRRQKELDSYYSTALEKQKEFIQLTDEKLSLK